MADRDLPVHRLSTTDAQGGRVYVYPADVQGRYRRRRTLFSGTLVAVFLLTPWIKIGGQPAILLDIVQRRFSIFGILFWAHDAPMLIFVFGTLAITLFFVTSVWGRVWCGWACPQTVFVEQVFRRIERWLEGDAVSRQRLDRAPWHLAKILRRGGKWAIYLGLALVTSHSFLAYFVGVGPLGKMMASAPAEHPSVFLIMGLITAGLLFNFGWFREQFCTIVCPYGRFQSVLMDDRSMVVAYDVARGEPRRGLETDNLKPTGDCVNCYRCVQVCPTGIDIRRGIQMECIACTSCIDACDEVMRRLKRPTGLIRYSAEVEKQSASIVGSSPTFRPQWGARAIVYGVLLAVLGTGLTYRVQTRELVEWTVLRAIGAPYQMIAADQQRPLVINQFHLDIQNQSFSEVDWEVDLPPEEASRGIVLTSVSSRADLPAGHALRITVFAKFPPELLDEQGRASTHFRTRMKGPNGLNRETRKEVSLLGPLG